jgi:hypothetical protein
MPCYEPPETYDQRLGYVTLREDRDKYVATLKEIEEYCKSVRADNSLPPKVHFVAQSVIDIIDKNWWRARQ